MAGKEPNVNKLEQIIKMEQRLRQIRDLDVLLENVLSCAREIVSADAGSIYEYDSKENLLKIRYSQNDTIQSRLAPGEKLAYTAFSFVPTTKSISGYCAVSKKILNIPDVYNLEEFITDENGNSVKRPFEFNGSADAVSGYKTHSMLTIPIIATNEKVLGVIQIINAQDENGNIIPFDKDDEYCISQFAAKVGSIYEYAYLTRLNIDRLIRMAGFRDPRETGAHVERVSSFAIEIYDRYAVNRNIPLKEREKFRDNLRLAARCHDVGKVAVPDYILKKQGILTDDERDIMKGHTCVGAQIFSPLENEIDEMVRDVCLHHHDRWDGGNRGYPGNFDYMQYIPETKMPHEIEKPLCGSDIPLSARIVALADVYDALRHKRCYKGEWTAEDTFKEIQSESGKQFDPELVEAFMQIKDRLEDINESIKNV
ncbi:MAG: HD domain-containing protein [Treponema sp.]|nr:HD domain-containing protein [Treponema sp.]